MHDRGQTNVQLAGRASRTQSKVTGAKRPLGRGTHVKGVCAKAQFEGPHLIETGRSEK
jgi:hypothetical protein